MKPVLIIGGGLAGGGAAWWSECPWGYPYDGWQCEVYVNAKRGGGGASTEAQRLLARLRAAGPNARTDSTRSASNRSP